MLFYRWKKVQMRRWLRQVNSATLIFWRFSKRRTDHIETSQLICKANQLTGFYMIRWFDKRKQKRKAQQLWNEVKSNSEYLANTIRQLKTKAAERKGVIHVFFKSNPIFRLRPYLLRVIHNFNPQVA